MRARLFIILAAVLTTIALDVLAQPTSDPTASTPAKGEGWFLHSAPRELSYLSPAGVPWSAGAGGAFAPLTALPVPGGTAAVAEAVTSEIVALARGLENDPQRIYEFVQSHIRYAHYFGSHKGAQLTLLERSGNDFDQGALLVALLRAAGYGTNATYRFGVCYFYNTWFYDCDYQHWVGTTFTNVPWWSAVSLFGAINSSRGFPYNATDPPSTGWTNHLYFHHVWVRLYQDANHWRVLDPSFKVTEFQPGIALDSASGVSSNSLWAAAGGTDTSDYAQNLNETQVRSNLSFCSSALLGTLQTSYPNAAVEAITGSRTNLPQAYPPLDNSPDYFGALDPVSEWQYIPTNLMATLSVSISTTTKTLPTPSLAGGRLSLTFGTSGLAELWLEDARLFSLQTTGSSSNVPVTISIKHPFGTWNTNNNSLVRQTWGDQTVTKNYQRTNASYAILYGFQPNQAWLNERQRQLEAYRQQGFSDSSRQVVTETLNVIGLNWLVQTEMGDHLLAGQESVLPLFHHRVGRMGQESGHGYYIDVYAQLAAHVSGAGTNQACNYATVQSWQTSTYLMSALEHGIIEQQQRTNLVAASTIKLLELANTNAQKVFLATSANWNSVKTQLTGYDTTQLYSTFIQPGYCLLLPASGAIQIAGAGGWSGSGYIGRLSTASTNLLGMYIDGLYQGGYVSSPSATPDAAAVTSNAQEAPDFFDEESVFDFFFDMFVGDPVRVSDGSFVIQHTDLSVGGDAPRGFTFTRYYSPTRRNSNVAALANGWTHNFLCNATEVPAPLPAFGGTTPQQMVPMLITARALLDTYANSSPNAKNWLLTALIAKWGADELSKNGVSITLGNDCLEFVKQPDGSFTPPANCTMNLLNTNGAYWLQERHGNTFRFNGTGLLTNILDQYNQAMTLAYDSSNRVQTVTDWKNRTLTFTYSGARLSSVSDSARSVSFGYSTTQNPLGDLTSVTDPEGKVVSYNYDTNHQIVATYDALSQLVVSNLYDSFGRITTQYTQGDPSKMWQIYWSPWQTVEQDPAGSKSRYYYDDKCRSIAVQDAVSNLTQNFYDGQDHLVMSVSPRGKTNCFYYDANHNLVASVDPLGLTNQSIFDAQNNLITSIDKRGYQSHFGYNSQFSLTGSTNGAGDWSTFLYNSDGTLHTKTEPGGTTTFGYDSYGQLNSTTYPGSLGSDSSVNNALGDVTSHTSARGFTTTFQYNLRRELTNTIAPTNLTSSVAFDAADNVQSRTDARGFSVASTWSPTCKLVTTTFPAVPGGTPVVRNAYDNRDWLIRTTNTLGKVAQFGFDAAQRPIGSTDPLLRTTSSGFDQDGHVLATTNAANEITRQQWDSRGRLAVATDQLSHTVQYGYDGAGNQINLTNRNGKRWQFQFDAANRLTNTLTPLGRQTGQSFNNRGLLQSVTDPMNQSASLLYDALGRLTNRTDPVGTKFSQYDADGNLTNLTEGAQSLQWQYDAYGRVKSYTDAAGNLLQYGYDPNGNLTRLVYPGGRTVNYAYDALNRLTNVTDWATRQTSFGYDLGNHLTSIGRPNGTVRQIAYDDDGEVTSILERTASGAPIAFFNLNWTNAGRVQWEFAAPLPHAYTPSSRTMTFDDDNRLATFNGQGILNDANGNMVYGPLPGGGMSGYSFNARNQLLNLSTQPASVAAVYCSVGTTNIGTSGGVGNSFGPVNLGTPGGPLVLGVSSFGTGRNNFSGWVGLQFTTGPAGLTVTQVGRWVLGGNSAAHAVKIVSASGADVPGAVATVATSGVAAGQFAWVPLTSPVVLAANATYFLMSLETVGGDLWCDSPTQVIGQGSGGIAYDPAGNRAAVTNGTAVTRSVVNPNAKLSQVLIRTKPDGSQTFYVYGNGLLYEDNFDPGGVEQNTRTYHFDYRGSTVALTDGSGLVTDRAEYSPYGGTTYRIGGTDTPFLYNGRYGVMTDSRGLLYMRARYYNPFICRFINPDPSGFSGGLNWYCYADGDPVRENDPLGSDAYVINGGGYTGHTAFVVDNPAGGVIAYHFYAAGHGQPGVLGKLGDVQALVYSGVNIWSQPAPSVQAYIAGEQKLYGQVNIQSMAIGTTRDDSAAIAGMDAILGTQEGHYSLLAGSDCHRASYDWFLEYSAGGTDVNTSILIGWPSVFPVAGGYVGLPSSITITRDFTSNTLPK